MAETAVDTNVKLTNMQRFCYAAGVIGMIVPFNLPLGYLTYYWTDIALIPPGIIGTFNMLCRLVDGIVDPPIGYFADNTKSKHGRYRPWMIPAGLLANLTCLALFTKLPNATQTTQMIWSFGFFFLYVVCFSCVEMPHLAMQAVLTTDYQQRGYLTSWRQTSASLVMTLMSAIFLPMTEFLVPGDLQAGYFYATLIVMIASAPFYFICFYGTKEVVAPPPADEAKVPFSESIKCLKGNTPVWMLTGAHLLHGLSAGFGSVRMYFWTYVAQDRLFAAVNGSITGFGGMFAAAAVGILLKKFPNKRNIARIGWGVSGILGICMYFIPVWEDWGKWAFTVMGVIRGFFGSLGFVNLFGMVPECTEWTMAKYGIRASGFIMAMVNISYNFGTSFGQGLFGWIMGWLNYVPTAPDGQSASMVLIFRAMMNWVGAACQLIGVLFFTGYKITRETHEELLRESGH